MTTRLAAACALAIAIATPAAAQEPMNDLEIAHAAYTAGAIDIRYAHLALALSETAEVRAFAALMIRDHSAVNDAAEALVAELEVTPQDNPMSRGLLDGAAQKRAELAGLTGEAFDCAYASNELGYHQTVNAVVEDRFIPAVTVAPLKDLLTDALATFKVHEGHAARMVEKLGC